MTNQQFRTIDDIRSSEILGKEYTQNHSKSNKRTHGLKKTSKTKKVILIVLIFSMLLFCLGYKLDLNNAKTLVYFNDSLKNKFDNVKDFIKNLFIGTKKYVTN